MDKKIAFYACKGCGIGEALDPGGLVRAATEGSQVQPAREHDCLCGGEGLEQIRKDLQEGVNVAVIAACSPRAKQAEFAFPGCLVERVNLRELVAWSHAPKEEETQALAEDYVRMAVARVQKVEPPKPPAEAIDKTVLVVGGGVSGLTAAREAARAGNPVVLVEKETELGGWLRKFGRLAPSRAPWRDLEEVNLAARVEEVRKDSRIKVLTGASIAKISGQPGQFDVEVRVDGQAQTIRSGAVVQATGWKPYDASRLGHLGYGRFPDVITNVQMEERLAGGKLARPSDGRPARRIAFIQCAGSRDEAHLPYCSTVCCGVTLKHALWARQTDPASRVYVFYKDIRTPGGQEDFYRRVQEDPGIFFTKGEVAGVEAGEEAGTLRVEVKDTLLGERIQVDADLVVLATGMVPASADGELIRKHRDAKAEVAKGQEGPALEAAKASVEALQGHEGTEILNLEYRQGPDLPTLKYSFPDSHFICFPYETRRTGIYAGGCLRAPGGVEQCEEDATGAALKAIQCLEMAARGEAVHPRCGDTSPPEFFLQRCTQCKRCTEECPFGTLNEDEKGTPKPHPMRCRRCGICLGACPERIISFPDYSIETVSSMIKAVQIPEESEGKFRLLGLVCENDAYPALDLAGTRRLKHSAAIRFVPVRCLGSVNIVWIADALSRGFDGILLVGCPSGGDYQCHYVRGSELMGKRGDNVREKLKQLVLRRSGSAWWSSGSGSTSACRRSWTSSRSRSKRSG